MQVESLRAFINSHYQQLRSSILEGSYKPQPVTKVEILKPHGGKRMLGIPTVTDRLIQQCINQILNPKYDATFDEWSYGFRPKRNAHQAVQQARKFLQEGYEWTVEIDLSKFFDKVNHDKLMGALMKNIEDKRVLKLIRSYLSAGIMEGGVTSVRTEGTPQGSPLSPLLSNIILDKLDKELRKRGHRFVRYADDCTIYVKSEKSAKRVAESIIKYIEEELKLQVNKEKTRTGGGDGNNLLGYSFKKDNGTWEPIISKKSRDKVKEKCKAITGRSKGQSIKEQINELQQIIPGWINYFILANAKNVAVRLDEQIRSRLRINVWKQWKRPATRVKQLITLGVREAQAYKWAYSSKGYCRIAHSQILTITLNNKYWRSKGYKGFAETFKEKKEIQIPLF